MFYVDSPDKQKIIRFFVEKYYIDQIYKADIVLYNTLVDFHIKSVIEDLEDKFKTIEIHIHKSLFPGDDIELRFYAQIIYESLPHAKVFDIGDKRYRSSLTTDAYNMAKELIASLTQEN